LRGAERLAMTIKNHGRQLAGLRDEKIRARLFAAPLVADLRYCQSSGIANLRYCQSSVLLIFGF
jgi:hypothetical protein